MARILSVALLTICLVSMGCPTRSLSPLFTESDVMFRPELIGSWKNVSEPGVLEFQKSGDNAYTVVSREKDTSTYKIQFGQLGKFSFIDAYSASTPDDYHLLPTHTIWRIWLGNDTIRLSSLEGDWLREMIEGKKLDVQHARQNGDIILTASTRDLQQFVLRYADDERAFPKPGMFVRMK